jgi:uncharacterized membrane protein YvbJ
MGRNEIRLRRQKMTSGRIAQHRNYADVMARHERDIKLKRIVRAFLYFLIIVFLVILFIIVRRWELKESVVKPTASTEAIEYLLKKPDFHLGS